ncbi:transglutaminase domain-containing protein [Breznakiellaceae bacterium SP9]
MNSPQYKRSALRLFPQAQKEAAPVIPLQCPVPKVQRLSLMLLAAAFLLLGACEKQVLRIDTIDPKIGMVGEILTISGQGFGEERNDSYITVAGIPPTSFSYLEWTDSSIQVKLPEFGESGLIYVFVGGQKSNPLLFATKSGIPELLSSPATHNGINPLIISIEPAATAIGALITIKGSGFSASREGSDLFFPWNGEAAQDAPVPLIIAGSDTDFNIEFWSDREIRARVPDGAASGMLELRTPRGTARSSPLTISAQHGTKTFGAKQRYTVRYSVDIQVQDARKPNALYLWVPLPVDCAYQHTVEILDRSHTVSVDKYRGTSLYHLVDLSSGAHEALVSQYLIEVYEVATNVQPARIHQSTDSPFRTFMRSSAFIPADNAAVKTLAASIVRGETNPYLKARALYQWLITQGGIQAQPLDLDVLHSIEEKRCDSYGAALLFCALARASDIPAVPVAGVLVDSAQRSLRHYWAEFWIDGFGWVPLDPTLGAGLVPSDFSLRPDHAQYYFGNMDNRRLVFSRGQRALSPMDPNGRVAARNRDYALQNLWEEAAGGLESYSSLWSDIEITGVYAQ